jgi:PAS domain S-box-containing protein
MDSRKILSSWSIQRKMLLPLLLIFLPSAGIILTLGMEQRSHEIVTSMENAMILVQSLATQQDHISMGTRQMLSTLALLPEVQMLDAPACNKLFRQLNNRNSFYSAITASTVDGIIFAGSLPFQQGTIDISDRKHIRDAINTLDFSAGEYGVGKLSQIGSLNYSFPVLDPAGNIIAVVTAGFKLDEFLGFISKANLSRDYAVTVSDHNGIQLYGTNGNETSNIGVSISKDTFKLVSGDSKQGTFEKVDEDGIRRLYAFKQLRLRENSRPYLYMIVSVTKESILHEANVKMIRNLGLLSISGLTAISLAWFFVNLAFVRPMKYMVGATLRFVNGDMNTRTGLPHTPDELGQLARCLDNSAHLLQRAHRELESKVAERTAELAQANETLRLEIAERKGAEEKLRESEKRFRQIAESIREVFWIADYDTSEILYISPAYEEVWGRTCESFYANPGSWIASIHAEDRERVVRRLSERGDSEQTLEYRVVRPDGSIRWVLDRAFPVADQSGRIYRFTGLAEDITVEKKAHDLLEEAHRKLLDIVEFLPDATFVIDKAGRVIAWNRAMEELTGVAEESMLGSGDYAYSIPFYGEPRPILIDLVMSHGSEMVEKYDTLEWKGNKLLAETYLPNFLGRGAHMWGVASPLIDGNIAGAIETLRDLSNRKELESTLRQSENELAEKADQLEETNTALRVILKHREEDRNRLKDQIQANLKELVLPYLEKVRSDRLDQNQQTYLALVESSLQELLSPFLDNVTSAFKTLTPTEIQVANLIKEGKTGKEIAILLGIAYKTVETHRYNLRIKLGLQNEKVNLRSYLLSLK